ncbi:MAG: response regulator [Candidatus Omnitrophica bacterium]|nr:response regulator [Candidatus Omnitrophota bacterium]
MVNENINILIVDDEETIRNMFVDILQDRNYRVDTAINGKETIEKIIEKEFDIAFLDVHMPIMNGLETLKIIKKIAPRIKVIMMDSFPDSLTQEAEKEGAFASIHKPFEIKTMLEIIDKALGINKEDIKDNV